MSLLTDFTPFYKMGMVNGRQANGHTSLTHWDQLVRYVSAKTGQIRYGEPLVDDLMTDIDQLATVGALKVRVLEGSSWLNATPTDEKDEVKKLLGPLTPRDVPIIRCTGLNYRSHSKFSHTERMCTILMRRQQFSNRTGTFQQTQHYSSSPDKLWVILALPHLSPSSPRLCATMKES